MARRRRAAGRTGPAPEPERAALLAEHTDEVAAVTEWLREGEAQAQAGASLNGGEAQVAGLAVDDPGQQPLGGLAQQLGQPVDQGQAGADPCSRSR
jgi:hypothetical protein